MRLLVVAFAVRALVPLGYMPDFSALSKGVLKVVICSASGSKTITIGDAHDDRSGQKTQDHNHQPCAFSGLGGVDLPQIVAVIEQSLVTPVIGRITPMAAVLPPARAGPQLGQRGPPLNS